MSEKLPGILCDSEIREKIKIIPFSENEKRPGIISYGLTSYGYDMRVADKYKVFTNLNSTIVDPKNIDESAFVDVSGKGHCIIPPNSFALCESVEEIHIPDDVMTVCIGKSTYARCGIIVNVTPLEAGWYGKVTIEISNTTPLPTKIYSNEGIMQVLFFQAATRCEKSYGDKNGKYQNQQGLTLPLIDK